MGPSPTGWVGAVHSIRTLGYPCLNYMPEYRCAQVSSEPCLPHLIAVARTIYQLATFAVLPLPPAPAAATVQSRVQLALSHHCLLAC